MKAAITTTARYLPEEVITNKDLERILDTNDDWITSRTGIRERRILRDPEKPTSYMCTEVARQLLDKRGISADEIDLIIVATMSPDMVFPATACIVQGNIGAKNAWGYDLSAACSGFVYGLYTGAQFIESGNCKKVMIIGADKMSSILDYTDRSTAILFGDGAGGVILEAASEEGYGVLDARLYSDGLNGKEHLLMPAGGSRLPASHETVDQHLHFIRQDGKQVFKAAVKAMADVAEEIMQRNHLTADTIDWLIPHQANQRIIHATADRMGLTEHKVMMNIEKYGNTTAGTVPICLAELDEQGKLHKGSNLVLVSFGAGYTWGGIYIRWQ
ncbi:MAG: ketoacyl-ACP synthase III [Chlorobiaceae bacterium]|nr:ketoacyl-ACP synthase III [Chlorobiaceae bacterium]